MITLPLKLRYSDKPLRQPAAWLIPGHSAEQWLAELLGWSVPLIEVALYAVPHAAGDRTPRGVLAIAPKQRTPRVSPCCQPYGRIALGGRTDAALYLPTEARLDPEMTDAEVASLLGPSENVWVLHPAAGLVGFDPIEARRAADLLQIVPPTASDWSCAEPGLAMNQRLLAIEPDTTPTALSVIDEGRGDIARHRPSVEGLPPGPGEPPSEIVGRPSRALRRQFARLMQWVAGALGQIPAGGEAAGSLGRWAQRQLAQLNEALLASRHREITRLLHMLEKNPEEGLRYALPFGGDQHRGIARPGGRLAPRNTDFSLRGLMGGGPADPWDLPAQFHARLQAKYHELASRELRLGRYRRAAYIYAALLGNLEMAASALKSGRFWREAAVLYRERLHRPADAAQCLEQGGLWTEAIALYEELDQWEKVGDLYIQLDQKDEAATAYRRAVETLLSRNDYLGAAKLLETKLADTDQAVECLDAGWPYSSQAGKCLDELFSLLARLGHHAAAHTRIARLRGQSLQPEHAASAAGVLARAATSYPDRPVQAAAADAVRTIAAEHLPLATQVVEQQLLTAVRRLVPADRLLARDCDRFPRLRSRAMRVKPPVRKTPQVQPTLVRNFRLPGEIEWRCAVSAGYRFYAAGYRGARMEVWQGFWNGRHMGASGAPWPSEPGWKPPILLAAGADSRQRVLAHVVTCLPLRDRTFPACDELPVEISVGTPVWLPLNTICVHRTTGGATHAVAWHKHGVVLHSFDRQDQPLGSRTIAFSALSDEATEGPSPFPMTEDGSLEDGYSPAWIFVRDTTAYLGIGDRLVILGPSDRQRQADMPGPIRRIHGSSPFSRARIVASLAQGAVLYWDETPGHLSPIAQDLADPVCLFTQNGWLVAASGNQCQVYRTAEKHQVRPEVNLPPFDTDFDVVAVLPTTHPDQFALLASDGRIRLFQMGSQPG